MTGRGSNGLSKGREGGPPVRVKMELTAEEQITVRPSNKILSSLLSRLPGSVYDLGENKWAFSTKHYPEVAAELVKAGVQFEKIPPGTLRVASRIYPDGEDFVLEGGIYESLLGFQREAVLFALNRGGRVLLADDMGLGKTIQALAIAQFYEAEFPLLIIAPASLLAVWEESVRKFLDREPVVARQAEDVTAGQITIISYNQAVTHEALLQTVRFRVVICDECHSLKHSASKRTRTLLPILQQSLRLIMISGTPAESRPIELFPIISALDKTIFPTFTAYGYRYCAGRKIHNIFDCTGCSNAKELSIVMDKAFMIRRMKTDVLTQLPKKTRRQVHLEILSAASPGTASPLDEQSIIQEFSAAAELKKEAVLSHLRGVLKRGAKITVFAHHQVMLDAIEELCLSQWIRYIRIDGSTALQKRKAAVEEFQCAPDVKIALLSIKACSAGLTLTAARMAVFAELYWNPGTLLQAEDRIHRIGQTEDVEVEYLIGGGTVDERVWPHLLRKMTVLESLGIGGDEFTYEQEKKAAGQRCLEDFFQQMER